MKRIFLLPTLLILLLSNGCRTYFGYEATTTEEDIKNSSQLISSKFKGYQIELDGSQIRVWEKYEDTYQKDVAEIEHREHVYIENDPAFCLVALPFRAIGDILILAPISRDWHLATNPPNFFTRLTYVPPFSYFAFFRTSPYWIVDPKTLKEGENFEPWSGSNNEFDANQYILNNRNTVSGPVDRTSGGYSAGRDELNHNTQKKNVIIKTTERERVEVARQTVTFQIPRKKAVTNGNIDVQIGKISFQLELKSPCITLEMLNQKPLPPKDISGRIQYGKIHQDFKINSLTILSDDARTLWGRFLKQNHVKSLIELRKQQLIEPSDFDHLLAEYLNKIDHTDIVVLSEQKMLSDEFLTKWLSQEFVDLSEVIPLRGANILSADAFSDLLSKNILLCSTENIIELSRLNLLPEELFRLWLANHKFYNITEIEKLYMKELITQTESVQMRNDMLDSLFRSALATFYKLKMDYKKSNTSWWYYKDKHPNIITEYMEKFTHLKALGWKPADFWLTVLKVGIDAEYALPFSEYFDYLLNQKDQTWADQYTLAFIISLWEARPVPQYFAGLLYWRLQNNGCEIPPENSGVSKLIGLYHLSQRNYQKAEEYIKDDWLTRQIQEEPYMSNSIAAQRILNQVQNSFVPGHDLKSLRQAVADYFKERQWSVKIFPSGKIIVEFSGYDNNANLCIIRFKIIESFWDNSKISWIVDEIAEVKSSEQPIRYYRKNLDFLFGKVNTTTDFFDDLFFPL